MSLEGDKQVPVKVAGINDTNTGKDDRKEQRRKKAAGRGEEPLGVKGYGGGSSIHVYNFLRHKSRNITSHCMTLHEDTYYLYYYIRRAVFEF